MPTIVVAQSESDTTQWSDLYAFKKVAIASGQPVDYDFSYNAPYDRAIGDVGFAVSSARLKEIMVVADVVTHSANSAIDVEILFLDLDQQYSFPNMLGGQQEFITLDIDYEDVSNEQASVIVTPKYEPAEGEEIGAKLIFVWELGWKRSLGIGLFEIIIMGIVVASIFIIFKMRD